MRATRSGGFTLAEVLVSLMVLCIVASALGPALLSGKLLLQKGYGRAEAVGVASLKMEENLAKSYSGLASSQGTDCLGNDGWIEARNNADCAGRGGKPFDWRVDVVNRMAGGTPYKEIQVQVSYIEGDRLRQTVSMKNYVPYPYIHIISDNVPGNNNARVAPGYSVLRSVRLPFITRKSIQVSYNIAIRVNDASGIRPLDTIYTMARVVRNGNVVAVFFPETRTPILTQPLINNWVQVDNIDLRGCELQILWRKDTNAGVVTPKMGNVIVIAVEEKA